MLAGAVVCALAGAVSGAAGASIPRAPSHRSPALNWLADDLPRADAAVPNTPAALPPRPPAQWRGADDRAAAPRDTLFRSHVTRISLPPPAD